MAIFSNSMLRTLGLFVTLGGMAGVVSAQLLGPSALPPKEKRSKQGRESVEWLWQYSPPPVDGRENELMRDARFKPLLAKYLTAPQAFWGPQTDPRRTLSETALDFLAVPGTVSAENDRYLTITGCVFHFCSNRGLLWVDLNAPRPMLIFAAIDWTTEDRTPDDPDANYTLWVFADQTLSPGREEANRIPTAFLSSIERWTAQPAAGSKHLQKITTAVLVDPDGTPHEVAPDLLGVMSVDMKKKDSK